MRDRSFVCKKASLLLALLTVAALVAPTVGMAQINPPQQIVFDFLTKSIGRSLNVRVLDPVETSPGSDEWIVKIKVPGEPKRITLATILEPKMKECPPANPGESPCRSFGPTGNVHIVVVDGQEVLQLPVPIEGKDLDAQIQALRESVNQLFNKNPLWVHSYPQDPPPAQNPTNRSIGLFYLFQKSQIQITTNDPDTYNGRTVLLAQDLFNYFLKTQVPATTNGALTDPIDVFLDTAR